MLMNGASAQEVENALNERLKAGTKPADDKK
jgi:hypothetical protein